MSQTLLSSSINLTSSPHTRWFPILVNIESAEYAEQSQVLRDHLADLARDESSPARARDAAQSELLLLRQKHRQFVEWAQTYRCKHFVNAGQLRLD